MIFSGDVLKAFGRTPVAAAVLGSLLLAACGGGDQKETFRASRIVSFGDENTLINPDGTQYTVNNPLAATATTPAYAPCAVNPAWIQVVATQYGLGFGECTGEAVKPQAQMKAAVGETVAGARDKVNAFHAATPLGTGDLVTLMVGAHDLLALYEANPTASGSDLTTLQNAAFERGRDLGSLAFEVVGRGPKVLITTVHNLSTAPLAPTGTDADAAARRKVLDTISKAFNDGLNDRLSDDPNGGGRSGAVLEVDQQIEKYRRNVDAAYTAIGDRINPACVVAGTTTPMADADLDTCTSTSATDARLTNLWAGRMQFGVATHLQLGLDAVTRITGNPL